MALNVVYKNRNGTTVEWTASTYILEKGELGVDTTLNIAKIGDGVKLWKDLDIFNKVDTSKYVTLDTEQTISGNKTFSKAVSVSTDSSAGFEITGGGNAWKFNARTLEGPLNIEGSGASGTNTYQFPNKTGTIALTSDIPSVPNNILTYDDTFDIVGRNLSYPLMIAKNTSSSVNMTRIDEGSITFRDLDRNNSEGTTQLVVAQVNNSDPVVVSLPSSSGELALKSDIPSVNNFVTLAGDQTITGAKTFNKTADFGNGISVGITDSTDRINIGVDSENHTGIIEFASDAVVGCTLTLPDRSGTIATLDDIPSTNNLVTTNTTQTISGVKTFSGNKLEVTGGGRSIALSAMNAYGAPMFTSYIDGNTMQVRFPSKSGVFALTDDLPAGETKVQFGDIIDHSSLQTTYNVTLDTSTSNLQDKTITALWVRLVEDTTTNEGYSYQIPIQDLYNFRDTSSGTLGAFSFFLGMPGHAWTLTVGKNSSTNITTIFTNGTLNYSIPLTLKMGGRHRPGSGVLLGFVYKGNKFAGSEVY